MPPVATSPARRARGSAAKGRTPLGIAVLLGLLAAMPSPRAHAQEGPPDLPQGPPPGEARPETPAERGRNNAAKLAGLVEFVARSCPEMQPDYDRFARAVAAMGVDPEDLRQGELKVRAAGYTQIYGKDAAESCTRAAAMFGETGKVIPGMIVRKDAAAGSKAAPR